MDTRNARLGRRLFLVYLVLYVAYVFVTALRPQTMDTTLGGVNLAIWSGAGLIGGAVLLALIYGVMCDDNDAPHEPHEPGVATDDA